MPHRHERKLTPSPALPGRDALLAIGVPEERQTLSGLQDYFPASFKIELAHFDLPTLSEVLLHLVKAGLIKVRHQ